MSAAPLSADDVRRITITAIASDDYLVERLVLKGGNALELIHNIGARASFDLDYSMESDFDDLAEVQVRLFRALDDRFDAVGYVAFDKTFAPRPSSRTPGTKWGGYNAEFKLVDRTLYEKVGGDLDTIRRQALETNPAHERRFRIEISPFEFCEDKVSAEVDSYVCYVYSVDAIAAEKLRAICQQLPGYSNRAHPAPRARDFYDIYSIVNDGGVRFDTEGFQILVQKVFAAKAVPLESIAQIATQREFHRADWPSVENAVRHKLRQFDFYFEFVLGESQKLEPLWYK